MKKLLCILLIFAGFVSVSADKLKFTVIRPVFDDAAVNAALIPIFNTLQTDLDNQFGDINAEPKNLIQGFGNAAVYASHGGTLRGYAGYNRFAFSTGLMLGVQLPASFGELMDYANEPDDFRKQLNDDGDIVFGINPQLFNINLGINTSNFLMDRLYLGVRFGYMNIPSDMMTFDNILVGVTANYQLFQARRLGFLLGWRGLSLGTGVIYQQTNLKFSLEQNDMGYNNELGSTGVTMNFTPKFYADTKITTVTIPLEAVTAVRLLFINIPFGVGVDLAFGKSDFKFGVDMDINFGGDMSGLTQTQQGSVSVEGGGDIPPAFANFKIMTGIGFVLGPVIIDVPVTIYAKNGFALGLTVGIVF